MNIGLGFRAAIEKLSRPLWEELETMAAQIQTSWNVEHNTDGTHGSITPANVTIPAAGDLRLGTTYFDPQKALYVGANALVASDNFPAQGNSPTNPPSGILGDYTKASFWYIGLTNPSITGIAGGTPGRRIFLYSANGLNLVQQSLASRATNRLNLFTTAAAGATVNVRTDECIVLEYSNFADATTNRWYQAGERWLWLQQHNHDGTHGAITATTISGTTLALTAQPASRAVNSVGQSIPDATETILTFDTNTYDIGGVHSTAVNTGRFTVPSGQGGTWLLNGQYSVDTAVNVSRVYVAIYKNGATLMAAPQLGGLATVNATFNVTTVDRPAAADYYEFRAFQVSGAARNTLSGQTYGTATKLW